MKEQVAVEAEVYMVWAKVKGYPWWPATIKTDPEQLVASHKYRVDFFGESSHSIVAGSMIEEFRAGYQEYSNTKNRKLMQAIRLADVFAKDHMNNESEQQEEQEQAQEQKEIQESKANMQVEEQKQQSQHQQSQHRQQSIPVEEEEEASAQISARVEKIQTQIQSVKRIRSERKFSEFDDEGYSPISKPNRHKGISKAPRASNSKKYIIPYRKYFDPKYEARIVDILNKIHLGIVNYNDISRLVRRMHSLDRKHLLNKYIFSGLIQMLRMLQQQNDGSREALEVIEEVKARIDELNNEIDICLSSTLEIEEEIKSKDPENSSPPERIVAALQTPESRKSFVQQIYRILKTKNIQNKGDAARFKSVRIFETFEKLINNNKVGKARQLLKNLMETEVDIDYFEKQLQQVQENKEKEREKEKC